jgi:hypothetical protein
MGKIKDPQNVLAPGVSIAPAADRTATTTGAAVDVSGTEQALVIFNYGVITDGTFTPSLTSSDTVGGSYTADTDFSGTMTAGTSAADELLVTVTYNGVKDFLKAVLTASGGPATGGEFSAVIVPLKNGFRP